MASRRVGGRRRALSSVASMLVAVGAVAGCSLTAGKTPTPQERNPTSAPATVTAAALSVPPGFDTKRGWQTDETDRAYTIAPRAGFLLDVYAGSDEFPESTADPSPGAESEPATAAPAEDSNTEADKNAKPGDGTIVIARSVDKGAVVWSSAPLKKLAIERAPELEVVNTNKGEFVVLVRFGVVPGDGLVRSRRLTVVDTFAVASSGGPVAPTQHLERETPGDFDAVEVSIGDGGVLFLGDRVESSSDDLIEAKAATLWNPTTGASTSVPASDERRSDVCGDNETRGCTVRDVPVSTVGAGVLTAEIPARPQGRFGLVGGWNSSGIGPDARTRGTLLGTMPGALLVAWAGDDNKRTLYAAHDPKSGAVLLSGECPEAGGGDADPDTLKASFAASPNGRYLVAGSVAIDLSARAFACLAGDGKQRGAALTSVGDNGSAFGRLLADRPAPRETDSGGGSESRREEDAEPKPPAVARPATRRIDPLPANTAIPDLLTASGAGLFTLSVQTEEDDTSTAVIAIYPAAQAPSAQAPSARAAPGS